MSRDTNNSFWLPWGMLIIAGAVVGLAEKILGSMFGWSFNSVNWLFYCLIALIMLSNLGSAYLNDISARMEKPKQEILKQLQEQEWILQNILDRLSRLEKSRNVDSDWDSDDAP